MMESRITQESEKDYHTEVFELKKQQSVIKKEFSSKFLYKLDEILEKCWLKTKNKKEHFITREKISLELLQLLQEQKRFKTTEVIQNELICLAVFDLQDNLLGKIISINYEDKTVEFNTFISSRNNTLVKKKMSEIAFFDAYSIQFKKYYELQKKVYDGFDYKESFTFLVGKPKEETSQPIERNYLAMERGVPLDRKIQNFINNIDLRDEKK